ncbi:MAG: hypothetical protein ACM3ZO_07290 [Clostridia bacterium]
MPGSKVLTKEIIQSRHRAPRGDGRAGGPWVTLGFRKYVDIEPGGAYETSPVVWRVHSGDWHEAARECRRWFDIVPLGTAVALMLALLVNRALKG